MMAPKISDVAREAGLSTAAVSRFLNGRIVLPPETARRIREAVERLDYRPNAIARRLSAGASQTLGFVTSDISHPFFARIASAAEAEAAERGYTLAIFNSRNDPASELRILARLADRQVDGLLFLTNHADDGSLARQINALGRTVLIDEDVPAAEAPRIFADNKAGGWLAARHLIEQGHRRIAFVGGPKGLISVEERLAGFRRAHGEAGLAIDERLVLKGRYDEAFGAEALALLRRLSEPATAVVAGADIIAVGILRAARQAGVRIPQDLSLIGSDDMSFADLLQPALTTVRQPDREFGRDGVRTLLDLLAKRVDLPFARRLPVELIRRASVAPPARR